MTTEISGDLLEFLEDDFEEVAYYKGIPFTGKTKDLKAGYRYEAEYKNGWENGLTLALP